ncbi:MAG: hypothetical protein EBU90_28875 [Proteobacteria bacterium]|nr:hypothetical protein [Pseudomonadota bacterium]NBP16149.1 hypothetical protein [bacterium]
MKSSKEKLLVYMSLAVFSTLQNEIAKITPDVLSHFNWLDFTRLFVALLMSGLVTYRAFIDQSMSEQKKADEK